VFFTQKDRFTAKLWRNCRLYRSITQPFIPSKTGIQSCGDNVDSRFRGNDTGIVQFNYFILTYLHIFFKKSWKFGKITDFRGEYWVFIGQKDLFYAKTIS